MAISNYHPEIPGRDRTHARRHTSGRQDMEPPVHQQSPSSKPVRKRHTSKQPLSPQHYIFITIGSLSISIAVLWYYVSHAAQLVQNGIEARFFYVLLILFGLSVAAFVFGVMNTYASYTGNYLSGTLKMGGPVVASALTIFGGFYLTTSADSFNITVRVFDEDAKPLKSGSVTLRLGPDSRTAQIPLTGEVDFKEIPRKFQNTKADIDVDVKGYKLAELTPQSLSPVINLKMKKINGAIAEEGPPDTFSVTVRPFGPSGEVIGNGVVTLYLGPDTRSAPIAQNGEANFKEVPLKFRGAAVRILVEANSYKMMDPQQFISLTDAVNVTLIKAVHSTRSIHVDRTHNYSKTLPEPKDVGSRKALSESGDAGNALNTSPTPAPSSVKGCTAQEIRLKQCQP